MAEKTFPTPTANDRKKNGEPSQTRRKTLELNTYVHAFPTPTASDGSRGISKNPTRRSFYELSNYVKLFPTPTSSMVTGADFVQSSYHSSKRPSYQDAKKRKGIIFPTPSTGAGMCGGSGHFKQLKILEEAGVLSIEERVQMSRGNGGMLNPDWEEWLMGWPVRWSSLKPMPRKNMAEWEKKIASGEWWKSEPVPRLAVKNEETRKRQKAIGNGQVPACAAAAWGFLS